jgi:hypothetical protein
MKLYFIELVALPTLKIKLWKIRIIKNTHSLDNLKRLYILFSPTVSFIYLAYYVCCHDFFICLVVCFFIV